MKLEVKPLAMAVAMVAAFTGFQVPQALALDTALVEKGKKVATNRKTGNCFACHQFAGATLAGTIGPPLVAMKARFPDKAKLRALIWDMTSRNPHTSMPPFGKHKIVSEEEIDALTEWVYSL